MPENILESYLIRLGATTDTASFTKFHGVLKDTGHAVESFTGGAVGSFVKLESTIVSTFAAAGVGLISLADKTALADQQFNIMGARMLMTKNSFRAMQSATDALGVSLSDIVADRTGELNNEFQDLYQRNLKLGKQLGTGFDSSMVGVRRLRVEFKQFETELEFLSAGVVSKLFEKLGFGSGDALSQLRQFNDWFSDNLPHMADEVSGYLIPVWKDMKLVLKDVKTQAEYTGITFTNMVAGLSGDESIRTSTFDLEKLARALVHVADGATMLSNSAGFFLKFGEHVASASWAGIRHLYNVPGFMDSDPTGEQDKIATREFSAAARDVRGILDRSQQVGNPDFANILEHEKQMRDPNRFKGASVFDLKGAIHAAAIKYQLDPALLAAVVKQESGGDPGARSPKGADGLMQLMSSTAKAYGVTNRSDPAQSIEGGAHFLADLVQKYGNTRSALAAYNEGEPNFNRGAMPSETRSYVDNIMRMYDAGRATGGDVIIEHMTIAMPNGIPEDRVKSIIKDSMTSVLAKRDRNTMAQTAAGAYW